MLANLKSKLAISAESVSKIVLNELSRSTFLSSQQNWTAADLAGFGRAQALAMSGAKHIAALIQPGWTEKQAASLYESYLCDSGVQAYFHKPFVWFGKRTLFTGIQTYRDFMPTDVRVKQGDAIILDAAPIYKGYACDIGYATSLGENKEVEEALRFLSLLKTEIPKLFLKGLSGKEIWYTVDRQITEAGYLNCHQKYPLGVLGHRLYKLSNRLPELQILRFGWQSYAGLAQHGLFSELLANFSNGDLKGLWAVEPHIGRGTVGAKFEEILVVSKEEAYWLSEKVGE